MKRYMIFLFLVCIIISSTAQRSSKKKTNRPKVPSSYFITNWSDYKMPPEIETEKLKKILEKIAAFKRLQYCPYGRIKKCQKASITTVIQKIVEDVILNKPPPVDNDNSAEALSDKKYSKKTLSKNNDHKKTSPNHANTGDSNNDKGGKGGGDVPKNPESGNGSTNTEADGKTDGDDSTTTANPETGSETGGADSANPEAANENGGDAANPEAGNENAGEGSTNTEAGNDNPGDDSTNPEAGDANGGEALRAREKLNTRSDVNSPKVYGRSDAAGNMVNIIKMVNFGNNAQYFIDRKDLSKERKHMADRIQTLNLYEILSNVRKTKRISVVPKSALIINA